MFQWWQYFLAWNLIRLELQTTCSTSCWPSWPGSSWSRSCWKCCSVWDEAPVSVTFFTHSSASSGCLIVIVCCCWLVSRVGSYQGSSSSSSSTEYPLKWCTLQRCLIVMWLVPGKTAAVLVCWLVSHVESYQGSISISSSTEYPLKWCALQCCLIVTWLVPGNAAAVSVLFLLSKKFASSCHFNALERNPSWMSNGMTLLK